MYFRRCTNITKLINSKVSLNSYSGDGLPYGAKWNIQISAAAVYGKRWLILKFKTAPTNVTVQAITAATYGEGIGCGNHVNDQRQYRQ